MVIIFSKTRINHSLNGFSYDYLTYSRKLKLFLKKKIEELEYLAIYLVLHKAKDLRATEKIIKARFQFSILNPAGIPGKQSGKLNYEQEDT